MSTPKVTEIKAVQSSDAGSRYPARDSATCYVGRYAQSDMVRASILSGARETTTYNGHSARRI